MPRKLVEMLRRSLLRPFVKCTHLKLARLRAGDASKLPLESSSEDNSWLPLYDDRHERQPYRAIAAAGPWIVAQHCKAPHETGIVYDAGGYGMLSFGHGSPGVLQALSAPLPMANIMQPHSAQGAFAREMRRHVGARALACLNSGSEANSLALRIAAVHPHPSAVRVALKHGFHGRTDGPAQLSSSSWEVYDRHAVHFRRSAPPVVLIEPNDVAGVHAAFDRLQGTFVEAAMLEPVLGEGYPALPLTPAFYRAVRERVRRQGGLLIVDSIQSGLRCHGCLSISDYPGFEAEALPDIEVFAKAINAGQFPCSALAFSGRAVARYKAGLYGNTMAANPRALEVVRTTLEQMTPAVRDNVRTRGVELVNALRAVCCPSAVADVRGVGLLVAIELRGHVQAADVQMRVRQAGVNVIQGGGNCVRITPWFLMRASEVRLVAKVIGSVLGARAVRRSHVAKPA